MTDTMIVLDFGSQTSQLICRRVREAQVYCELFPWDAPAKSVMELHPAGFILSGGPASVYDQSAPIVPAYVLESGRPILGICYGMQALAMALQGRVASSTAREFGLAQVETRVANPLLPDGVYTVWMSHGDRLEEMPPGFQVLASSPHSPIAAMGCPEKQFYGVQFHPEVHHTPCGGEILRRFVVDVCGAKPDWTPESIITRAVRRIHTQVGSEPVLAAVSGGVDSSVAAALVRRAIGDQLSAVFVDHGLLRKGERGQVQAALGSSLITVDAVDTFLSALKGVTEPETKRRIIGETFIRVFEREATRLGSPHFLVQGTIYPDVVESAAPDRSKGHRIKTHHNVGGLPSDMKFELVEPLRYLFKDEVRLVGEALGLPGEMVWRQPFPGPGLAVRCLGEVTPARLEKLREADAIFIEELTRAGYLKPHRTDDPGRIAQAFAALLPCLLYTSPRPRDRTRSRMPSSA